MVGLGAGPVGLGVGGVEAGVALAVGVEVGVGEGGAVVPDAVEEPVAGAVAELQAVRDAALAPTPIVRSVRRLGSRRLDIGPSLPRRARCLP
jgi:hypothetical protein